MQEEPRNKFLLPNVFSSDNDFRKNNNNNNNNNMTGSFIKSPSNNGNYINIHMNQGKNEYKEREIYSNEASDKKATYNLANQFSNRVN